jgi:hypothetical protein
MSPIKKETGEAEMRIGKHLKALSLAVFAAMAIAAIEFGPGRPAKPAAGYIQFTGCPSAASECIHNTNKGGREKVTNSPKEIQQSSPMNRLCKQTIFGKTCYVGGKSPVLDTEELSVTAIDVGSPRPNSSEVSVENDEQTKSFYELSQRKDHLA